MSMQQSAAASWTKVSGEQGRIRVDRRQGRQKGEKEDKFKDAGAF